MNYRFFPQKFAGIYYITNAFMFGAEIKWGSHKSKHPDSWQQLFLNRNSLLDGGGWSSITHLYTFISSWSGSSGDPGDVFNFRWGQNFLWCQMGSRQEPLSWLLHLLYIFITGLFSSCRVPTHTYKEKNPHPLKPVDARCDRARARSIKA